MRRFYKPVKKHRPKTFQEQPVELGKGLSPMTVYLMQNEASGLSRAELVQQFHEYDCEGELESICNDHILRCTECDYWEIAK